MIWTWAGDRALLVEISDPDLETANARVRALHRRLSRLRPAELEDLVPAARTLLALLRPGAEPSRRLLAALDAPAPEPEPETVHVHEILVEYGGDAGPDLADVAKLHGLSEAQVIELHTSVTYTVGFCGFTPGFPYLIGLARELATPRLATPRTRIPAGSVAIGGEFTGIYPRPAPGGWRLIGRSDAALFDLDRDPPALLLPGERVRFLAR